MARFRAFPWALAACLALPAAVAPGGPAAAAVACPAPHDPPQVALKELRGRVTYSNGHSSKQLGRKHGQGGAGLGANWQHVGLTGRNLVTELRIGVRGSRNGNGIYCARLAEVEMTVGYDRIKVYIDRRYRPGSCEYQAVLDHENEHVENFKTILADHLPLLRDRLSREVARLGAIPVRALRDGAERFRALVSARMEPHVQRMMKEMAAADARIDTPESYRANQARCTGW